MSEKGNLLGATTITRSYSITLITAVRNQLGIKTGDVIGFYSTKENALIIVPSQFSKETGDLFLLGSSTLTTSNTVTLPKKVRNVLKVGKKAKLAYYQGLERQVIVTTG